MLGGGLEIRCMLGKEEVNKPLKDGGDLERKAEASFTKPHIGPHRADSGTSDAHILACV